MSRIHFFLDPLELDLSESWPKEEARIRSLTNDFSIHVLRGKGHAEHLLRDLHRTQAELVVAVGGDRLVHELANTPIEKPGLHIAFHRELCQGNFRLHRQNSKPFLEFLRDFLSGHRRTVAMDLGEARFVGNYGEKVRRYFFSHASFGLPAAVLHRLPAPSTRRQAFRTLLRVVPFYRHPAFRMEVNGRSQPPDFFLGGFVQNIPWCARGVRVAGEALDHDSLLDFIALRPASWLRTSWAAARLLFKDELSGQFMKRESVRHLKIESTTSQRNVRIELDGESWGHLPVEIENRAARFKFLE